MVVVVSCEEELDAGAESKFLSIPIESYVKGGSSKIEKYWTSYTIAKNDIGSKEKSLEYMQTINALYPFYFNYCDLYGDHSGETVLDYGCGPGNDLAGYFAHSSAKQIIGVDISIKALEQARERLLLHGASAKDVRLFKISDNSVSIPLDDNSVDYIQSLGVIHHASDPNAIIKEIYRVLKPGSKFRAMVYHKHSLYVNLTIPYEVQIINGQYQGLDNLQAFAQIADSGAPKALLYTRESFADLAKGCGFNLTNYNVGFSITELCEWRNRSIKALQVPKFPEECKTFLCKLEEDKKGLPIYNGKYAGMNAIFEFTK